jgi:hypothetical protein
MCDIEWASGIREGRSLLRARDEAAHRFGSKIMIFSGPALLEFDREAIRSMYIARSSAMLSYAIFETLHHDKEQSVKILKN